MGTNILNIGQSALAAAQLGITTTGQNIANASTPGYSRQVVVQTANEPQNLGGSFVGQGVSVSQIQRQYDQFISQQVNSITSTKGAADAYLAQISTLNNLVGSQTSGVSPALQTFFSAIQNVASSPNGTAGAAARQSALSSAQSLVGSINGLQTQINQISADVNGQIGSTVNTLNTYSQQIAKLNDTIAKAESGTNGSVPNDLLDQRDYLVTQMSQLTQVSVVQQGNQYNVFIGNGQPVVMGANSNSLQVTQSATDPTRTEISYASNGKFVQIPENGLTGGSLGGLFDFRANMLDPVQNSLGRIALTVASNFNQQSNLGLDLNGQQGSNVFSISPAVSTANANNTTTAQITTTINNVSTLTTSSYSLLYQGGKYQITRLSDGTSVSSTSLPAQFDGMTFNLAPPPAAAAPAAGDQFLIRPTANAAASLAVAITDPNKIAAAAPMSTSVPSTNTGNATITSGVMNSAVASGSTSATATISPVKVDASFATANVATPITLTYSGGNLTGFPASANVTVTNGGVTTNYPAPATVPYTSGATVTVNGMSFAISNGTGAPTTGDTFTLGSSIPVANTQLTYNGGNLTGFPANANVVVTNGGTSTTYVAGATIPFKAGATYSYNGLSVTMSGTPANGDVFNIAPNTKGSGDNRNALVLQTVQTQNLMMGGTTTIQGGFAQFVSLIGNKTNEVTATSKSETTMLTSATNAQQSVSGVNLDEEASNLLKYQQTYQAAAKLMQIASTLFNQLLTIGQ